MRGRVVLVALLLVGCGGSKEAVPKPEPGKTVRGATETGMALKVETFVDPAKDPRLKRIDEWRSQRGYRAVDFHRVTADNAAGPKADSGRTVRFAPDATRLAAGQGIEARFSCDALEFEWLPTETADAAAWNALRRDVCAARPAEARRHRGRGEPDLLPRDRPRLRRARLAADARVRAPGRGTQVSGGAAAVVGRGTPRL